MALVAASAKPAVAAADRQSVHSFGSLLQQLELHSGQLIPPAEEFLVKNASRLACCYDLFGLSKSTTSSSHGKQAEPQQPREKELVKAISEKFEIQDQDQAASLLRGLRKHLGEDLDKDVEPHKIKDDAFWEAVTAFFFEERLAVLHVLAHVLRTVDLEDQPAQEIYLTVASQASQPAFAKSLLDQVAYLASTPVPATSRPFTTYWAKQYAKEQKALLEVYFLLHYNKILPTGRTLLDVLEVVKATEWGLKQANEGYFDAEAYAQIASITCLFILICLECLNLERASSTQGGDLAIVPGSPPAEDSLMHPATLSKIHSQTLELVASQPNQSGPLLLGWAFVLSRITESMTSVSLPETYYEVAAEILPSDMHPRRNTGQVSANTSKQPVYTILASHALSPEVGLLPAFQALLTSQLLGRNNRSTTFSSPGDPNVPGYLSVARSLISVLPLLVHPSYLPPNELDALVSAMEMLYSNPAASLLRGQFWGLFEQADEEVIRGEWEVLEVVRSRFPAELEQFLRLMNSLSGTRDVMDASDADADEEKELSQRCSAKVREYMASLPTLTQVLSSMSPVVPLPYEASPAIDAGPLDVVSLRSIAVSPSVHIPAGCPGRFVSEQDRRPVVIAWDLANTDQGGFSAWLLAGDVLKQFVAGAGRRSKSATAEIRSVDVFTGDVGESAPSFTWESDEAQIQTIASILSLLHSSLASEPEDTLSVISLLSLRGAADMVDVLLAIIDKAASIQPAPEAITVPCTLILRFLLREAPPQIWSYIRGSGVLLPLEKASAAPVWGSRTSVNRSLLAQDKSLGTYAQTLATLSLIEALIHQARSAKLLDASSVSKAKAEVLNRAIQWCFEGLWANFSSWKFAQVEQKYELAARLASIFLACLEDADCGSEARSDGTRASCELVIKNFLVNANAAYFSSLFQFVTVPGSRGPIRDETVALAAEHSTEASLNLLVRLLGLSRQVLPDQPSTLERVCFSHSHSGAFSSILSSHSTSFIATLFSLLQGNASPKTATAAATILSELCSLSKDWEAGPERPSFLSHLGGVKNTQKTVEGLVSIAGDPFVDAALQLAAWDLLIDIVQSQPGLADVLIAGQNGIVQLGASTISEESDSLTAASLAMQVLTGWREAWDLQPAVLAAALNFLCAAWEGYIESNKRLKKLRTDAKVWQAISEILAAQPSEVPAPVDIEDVDAPEDAGMQISNDCYRRLAKSGAARLAALDAQYAVSVAEDGKTISDASVKCLSDLVSVKDTFEQCVLEAITVEFDPQLVESTRTAFTDTFRKLHLEAYQHPSASLNKRQRYGSDYFYDSKLLRNHLQGLESEASESAIGNALTRVEVLNLAMSQLHASSSLLGAWNDLLEIALPKVTESKAIGDTVWSAIQTVAKRAGQESRSGRIIEELHGQRLKLLKTLLEYGTRRTVSPSPADLPATVEQLRVILSSDTMSILDSVKGRTFPFHRSALQVAYLVFYKLGMVSDKSTSLPRSQQAALLGDSEASLSIALAAIRSLLSLAAENAEKTAATAENLALVTSVILQILSAPVQPRPSVWLAHCQDMDLFRIVCDFLSAAPATPAFQKMVQTLYELCTAFSTVPQAAEKLALEGLVTAMNNNSLTQKLEDGTVRPPSPIPAGQADPLDGQMDHAIWCSILATMTQLITQLGDSAPFMENEVVAFSKLYSRQISQAYHWTSNDTFTTSTLTELQNTTSLLNAVVSANSEAAIFQPLLRKQINGSLSLLQQMVYLLQHPNVLSTMLEPLSYDERTWLQSETSTTTDIVLSDLHKRPAAAAILQAVFKLSHVIVMTLVRYTKAFTILAKETFDWPKDRAVVQPNSNVSLDEPATLGTLFDLARFSTDAVRYCNASATPPNSLSPPTPLTAYESGAFIDLANYTLEGTLLLMSTQIALAVQQQDSIGHEIRAAQRARRDLKELAGDLIEEFLDKPGGNSDSKLLEVMKAFMLRL